MLRNFRALLLVATALAGVAFTSAARAEPLPTSDEGYARCAGDESCEQACFADRPCLERMVRWLDAELARLRREVASHGSSDVVRRGPDVRAAMVPPAPR